MSPVRHFIYRLASIDWTSEAVTAAGTIALAFLTLVLAAGTLFLWCATRRLVRGTEKTAKHQLRAYIHVVSNELTIHPDDLGGWKANITIKNFGQTPAFNMTTKVEKKIRPAIAADIFLEFSDACILQPEITIGPGGSVNILVDFSEIPINPNEWNKLREQCTKGYVWGRIDYVDAFNDPRFTTFQMINHFAQIHQFCYCLRGNGTEFSLPGSPNAIPRK